MGFLTFKEADHGVRPASQIVHQPLFQGASASMYSRRLAISATLLACTPLALAQTSKGILAGVARDSTGAVIPDAQVTATDQQTGVTRTTSSKSDGSYRIEGIDPDQYTVRVTKPGFSTSVSKDLTVTPSQVTAFDPTLAVGSDQQEVTVEANSNAINTENGHLSGTVSEIAIDKIPIFSNSPIQLAAIVPGVSPVNQTLGLGSLGGNGQQIQVNGARPRSNNFLLDGQDINDIGIGGQAFQPAILDAFQSVSVLTNSSSAEYGRSGGAVVNTITKTGTNQFHGTAYELYQGSGLNSIDGQTRKTLNPNKARYDQHTFGGVIGGPIVRDKLFAFGGVQFQKFYGNGQANPVVLPDVNGYATLKGIPGAQSMLLQQYLNNGSYLGLYQQGVADTTAKISPRPGCPSGCSITTAFFVRPPVPQQNPDTQFLFRVDFSPRAKDTFTYRYLHDRTSLTPDLGTNTSGLIGFDNTQGGPSELAQGEWTHIFTPTLINEFRAGETRISFAFAPLAATVSGPLGSAPNLNFSGLNLPGLGVDQNLPQGRSQDLYQIQDTVGWTIGKQSLRIGVDLARQLEKDQVSQNAFGSITYGKTGTALNPALSSLDNFLNNDIGTGGSVSKSFGPTRIDPHVYKIGAFVQDDIKLTSEFTFNIGLRYDYFTPPENALPYPSIDVSNLNNPIGTVVKVKPYYANLGPRVAFAYAPQHAGFIGRKSVLHGGFGMFYDTDFSNIAVNNAQSSPNSPTSTLVATTKVPIDTPSSTLIGTLQPQLNPLSSVQTVSSNLRSPLTYQYNFGFERGLPGSTKLTINYVGNRALRLYSNQQYNYFNYLTGTRLNSARGAINARINDGVSNYNSIQVEVSHQFSKGLYIESNYIFSKTLDDSSEVFTSFQNPNTSYGSDLAPGHRGRDYGNSVFDHRHFFSVAYVYSPRGFRASNALTDGILSVLTRNFTFSGLTQLQSGSYSSFQIGGIDINGDGNAFNDRPLVGNPKASPNLVGIDGSYVGGNTGTYYDLAANNVSNALTPVLPQNVRFLVPAAGGPQYIPQEIGRNSFSNPGTTTHNVAAEKDIPLHRGGRLEAAQFQFRVEAQNVFNHNDVGILTTDVLQVGASPYLDPVPARVNTNRNVRGWVKFAF